MSEGVPFAGLSRAFSASRAGVTGVDMPDSRDPYSGYPALQWWLVAVLMAIMMLANIDRQLISLLINPIKADLGLTDTQIGLVYGAGFALANVFFTIPAGHLADRFSRRSLIGAGVAIWSGMTFLCGTASSFIGLLLTRAGVGCGEGVVGPCSLSMLRGGLSPERLGRGIATWQMAQMAGSALALVIGGFLLRAVTHAGIDELPLLGRVSPWQVVLMIVSLFGIPVGLLLLTVREPLRAVSASADSGAAGQGYREALRYMRGRWAIYAPLIAFQIVAMMTPLSFGAWLAPMIGRTFHIGMPEIGARLGLMMAVLPILGLLFSGWLFDRYRTRGVVGLCGVGLVFSITFWITASIAPLSGGLPTLWFALSCHLLVGAVPNAFGNVLAATVTPKRLMGRVVGIQLFLNGLLSASIGPVIVALVADGVFAGDRALAHALSLMAFIYGLGMISALVILMMNARGEAVILNDD